jgi:hypothetical protein
MNKKNSKLYINIKKKIKCKKANQTTIMCLKHHKIVIRKFNLDNYCHNFLKELGLSNCVIKINEINFKSKIG